MRLNSKVQGQVCREITSVVKPMSSLWFEILLMRRLGWSGTGQQTLLHPTSHSRGTQLSIVMRPLEPWGPWSWWPGLCSPPIISEASLLFTDSKSLWAQGLVPAVLSLCLGRPVPGCLQASLSLATHVVSLHSSSI